MKSIHCYLGFSHCMGIGPKKFDELISHFSSVETAYCADFKELAGVLGTTLAQDFDNFRHKFRAEEKYQEIIKKEIHIVTREDANFPQSLKNINDAPICLYIKGDMSLIDFQRNTFIALVGTRKASSYGVQMAKTFSSQLASNGIIIVSGMAMGIDAKSHWAALDVGGKTIAFLGCGVDRAFPTQNYGLYHTIIQNGGLVISEFPPGMHAFKGTFVSRNRLISGISEAVLVIEGSKTSGSLITAKCAAEQSKEVFAIPGLITSELAEGPHILIKNGAQLVTCVDDIFDALSLNTITKSTQMSTDTYADLTVDQREIIYAIRKGIHTIDDIAVSIQKPISLTMQAISMLEIGGYITKSREGSIILMS